MKFTKTLKNYRDEVKRKLGIAVDVANSEWPDLKLNDNINEARQRFWDKARYKSKYSVAYSNIVSGQQDYDFTNKGIDSIDLIRYSNGTDLYVLDFVSLDDFLMLTRTAQSGDARAWTFYNNDIKLYPTPSVNVTNGLEIYGAKEITTLSGDSDIDTDIENKWLKIIVEYATGLAWDDAEQESQANRRYSIFEKMFDEAAFEINSMQFGKNTPDELSINGSESNEWRWSRPIG